MLLFHPTYLSKPKLSSANILNSKEPTKLQFNVKRLTASVKSQFMEMNVVSDCVGARLVNLVSLRWLDCLLYYWATF